MFLSCHVRVSEWIYTLYLPECQETLYSKQAKWLSVRLQTKGWWVRVQLQSLGILELENFECQKEGFEAELVEKLDLNE